MPQTSTLPALYPVKKMGEQPATQKQSQLKPRSARSSGAKSNRPSLVLQVRLPCGFRQLFYLQMQIA